MRVKILNISVDNTTKEEILDKVTSYLIGFEKFLTAKRQKTHSSYKSFFIVTPNPEIALKAADVEPLCDVINNADFAVPDGIGFKLASRGLKIIKGRELMVELFRLAHRNKYRIYLFGSTQSTNSHAVLMAKSLYPNIKIHGNSGPIVDENGDPKDSLNEKKEAELVGQINRFKPHILFVALGAPKQELWSIKWLPKLNVGGVMVVGGALDYFAGRYQVPKLMSKLGLEWLFRVYKEPHRVGRIFNAVVVFPIKLLVSKF